MVCNSRAAAAAGKTTLADGRVYEGEWKDDKQNGKGEERGGLGHRARRGHRAGRGETRVVPGRPGGAWAAGDGWQDCKGPPLRETER